jgi:sulfate/thiosulfate transport system substrate-binding protein
MNLWQRPLKQLQFMASRAIGFRLHSLKGFVSLFLLGAFMSVSLAACSGGNAGNSTAENPGASPVAANKQNVEVTLVSFAVTKAAHEAIIPKFVKKWQQEHNQTVTFKQSYGGSGSQTRAVIDGLEADARMGKGSSQ